MTTVETAAKEGDLEFIRSHVTNENINQKFDTGRTALHLAAEHGHASILQFLVDNGADIECPDLYGIRPLLSAVWEERKDCVKILLDKGAERNLIAVDGTPLIECTRDPEIRQMLQS